MKGSIVTKGGRHYVVTRHKDTAGVWRQRTHGGHDRKKDAEKALRDMLSKIDGGMYVEPSKLTFGAFLEKWLTHMADQVRDTTHETYRRNAGNHVLPALGAVPLQKLRADHLDDLYAALRAGGRRDGKPLAVKSVRNVHVMIHTALKYAVRKGLVPANVADNADPPKVTASADRKRTWTGAEVRHFLDHIADHPLHAPCTLMANTGMRRGEVLGLRWSDVNLDAARLSVAQQAVCVNYEVRFSAPKTEQGRRTIDLDAVTVGVLRAHRTAQARARLAVGAAWTDLDLVFPADDGKVMHPQAFSQAFDRLVAGAGLPRVTPHGLRHGHGTLAMQAGVNTKIVQERLGHHDPSFTARVYQHVQPGMQADAARQVAALVYGDSPDEAGAV